MKMSKMVVLSLTMISAQVLAFQSKDMAVKSAPLNLLKETEESMMSNYYRQHTTQLQMKTLGTCAATPISGCNCPFCSILRGNSM